ncbi:MAG: hypothetical protein J3Q66DRAFT_123704 [Benniella sp.]|nr:MAG: hypothetical protein J3Q66DRAFT_123704 [Benniella sp.]
MSSSRPLSREQQLPGNGTAGPRPKVATSAQIDISSILFSSKPSSLPGSGTVTPTNSGRGVSPNGNNGHPPPHSKSSQRNSTGSSSSLGYTANGTPPPRLAPNTRSRSSNSVVTTATLRNTLRMSGDVGNVKSRDVSSDDDSVSDDSDRSGDEMHFPRGHSSSNNSGVTLPFEVSGRQGSPSGSTNGSKIMVSGMNRQRPTSGIVGLSGGGSSLGVTPKLRIAASAKIDSGGSTAGSPYATLPLWTPNSSTSNLTLSRQQSRDRDEGSTLSMNSGVSAATTRSIRSSSAVAANKHAEENRRAEEVARTRRKIADLEISNTSLMDINRSLEATIRKQQNEVQELKMRMQAAQLGELGYTSADVARAQSVEAIELTEADMQDDLMFKRLCMTIEQLVYEAKSALNHSTRPAGVKVLSLYEMYQKEAEEEDDSEDEDNDPNDTFIRKERGDMNSIEVMRHDDSDDDNDNDHDPALDSMSTLVDTKTMERTTLSTPIGNSLIAPVILDAPLAMVT